MKLIIDIPNEGYDWIKNGFPDNEDKEFLIKAVKNGTPYDERPQGEWEDYSVNFYKCPECGYLLNKDCPHCQNKIILPKGGANNE